MVRSNKNSNQQPIDTNLINLYNIGTIKTSF